MKGALLFICPEYREPTMAAGIPVPVVGHEEAPTAPFTEWPRPLEFSVLDLVLFMDLFR